MSNYVKPKKPLYSKENEAYFYPLTTSDQVIMPDGSRLTPDKLEAMILETATPENIGALTMELLWENDSPTSEFAENTFTISSENSPLVIIEFYSFSSNGKVYKHFEMLRVGYTALVTIASAASDSRWGRGITVNPNSVYCENGYKNETIDNSVMIPIKIYGIKGVS